MHPELRATLRTSLPSERPRLRQIAEEATALGRQHQAELDRAHEACFGAWPLALVEGILDQQRPFREYSRTGDDFTALRTAMVDAPPPETETPGPQNQPS